MLDAPARPIPLRAWVRHPRGPAQVPPEGSLVPFSQRTPDSNGWWRGWRALTKHAPPFLSPEFFALSRPLLGPGQPLLVVARRGERILGVLPLFRCGRTLSALRTDHTPRYDYCGAPETIADIWAALRADPAWDQLVLKNLPADSPLLPRLARLAERDGYLYTIRPGSQSPRFALLDFADRMDAKFRTNVRRCARKAGGLTFERLTSPSRADFADALAIEAMAWKGQAGTSIDGDARLRHLYLAMARLFGRRGQFALDFVRAGGRRIAALYSFEDRDTLYAVKIGYDPAYADLSPGHLLVWEAARDAEQRGLKALDFLGHEDPWKLKWTDQVRPHVSLIVNCPSPRGVLAHTLRTLVRPCLVNPLRQWMGRPAVEL